jgi:V/A-type H+-transporting ATPase subunit K
MALLLTVAVAFVGLLGSALLWAPGALAAATSTASLDPSVWRWGLLAAALATAVSAIAAAYAVATVGSAAVGALAEKPELFGRILVLVGLAEGIAIYGLIISILIVNRLV